VTENFKLKVSFELERYLLTLAEQQNIKFEVLIGCGALLTMKESTVFLYQRHPTSYKDSYTFLRRDWC